MSDPVSPREPSEEAIGRAMLTVCEAHDSRPDVEAEGSCVECYRAALRAAYAVDGLSAPQDTPPQQETAPELARALATVDEVIADHDRRHGRFGPKDDCLHVCVEYKNLLALRSLLRGLRGVAPERQPEDGVVRGEDARRIQHEIAHGTPDTPQRIATIADADRIYREVQARSQPPQPPEPQQEAR